MTAYPSGIDIAARSLSRCPEHGICQGMSGRLQGFYATTLAVFGVVMEERPCMLVPKSQKFAITETGHTRK